MGVFVRLVGCVPRSQHVVAFSVVQSVQQAARLGWRRHEGVKQLQQAAIRAETCPSCQGYLKLFYLEHDSRAEAVADDLASLDLDLRLSEEGHLRHAPNLLLAPGDAD